MKNSGQKKDICIITAILGQNMKSFEVVRGQQLLKALHQNGKL